MTSPTPRDESETRKEIERLLEWADNARCGRSPDPDDWPAAEDAYAEASRLAATLTSEPDHDR